MTSNDHGDTPSDGEADLPGLEDDDLVEADLPGLEPDPRTEPAGAELQAEAAVEAGSDKWTHAQLNEWFEEDFGGEVGGHEAFMSRFFSHDPIRDHVNDSDDLAFGVGAYKNLMDPVVSGPLAPIIDEEARPWLYLSHEAKERFRRGWQEVSAAGPYESVIDELEEKPVPDSEEHSALSLPAVHFLEGWEEDVELIEDPTIRRAITDRIESTDELVELGGGPTLSESWEDVELIEDPTIRRAITDRIESTDELVESGPASAGPTFRWILVGGGLGVLGLVLAVGFFVFSGSDSDTDSDATPNTVVAAQDESAGAIAEPDPQVGVEESAAAVEDDSGVVIEDEAQVAVDDPLAQVTIVETTVLTDPDGDLWVEVTLAAPFPPAVDSAFNMIVSVGISSGGQFHGTQWSLENGSTRGQGFITGDVRAALDGEIWVTEKGNLVFKLPGQSATGGLSASDLDPDAEVVSFGQLIPEEGDEFQRTEETMPLGEVTQVTDSLPRSDWQRVETDFGPVTLVIPGGEGSGG